MRRLRILVLFAALVCPVSAMAECIACTESHGVVVTLRDGSKVAGYVQWNHHLYWSLVSDSLPGDWGEAAALANSHAIEQGWLDGTRASDEVAFRRWIAVANLIYSQGVWAASPLRRLRVFERLEQIQYPAPRFVGVEGHVVEISGDAVLELAENPQLTVRTDTTGMDTLAPSDIRMLQGGEPRLVLEVEGGAGAVVYLVYGDHVSLEDLLRHVAAISDDVHSQRDLVVNSIPVSKIITLSDEAELPPGMTPEMATACRRFHGLESSVRADLDEFLSELTEPGHADTNVREGIVERKQPLRDYSRSLGSEDDLRRLGVIQFGYAWD